MDYKSELKKLVETVKLKAKKSGGKLMNEEIANRMQISRTYLSDLLGVPGKEVTSKHVELFKLAFKEELLEAGRPAASDQLNPERAMILALLEDYAEWKAEMTDSTFEEVKESIKKRGTRILGGLDSWLPE